MKKYILFFISILFSSQALAEWTLVYANDETDAKYYVDLATLSKKKDTIRLLTLEDFRAPVIIKKGSIKISYNSIKSLTEFNCSKSVMRVLSYSVYENQMGHGDPLMAKGSPFEWSGIKNNTLNEAYLNI
ncbi:MAG: hypothetical protein O3A03_06340, partial [Proteobacteria bacterium]|nr:hypothetical protein [Pseudomonadota bacterium]